MVFRALFDLCIDDHGSLLIYRSASVRSDAVLAGVPMPAGCGIESSTHQITRKHPYKTLDLRGRKSPLAMTMPRGAFYVITRKEIAPSANLAFYGMAGERAAAKSAGSGGNRPATHTTDASPQPAFSPIGQGCLSFRAESSRRGINPRQSPPRGLCAVGAWPEGGECAFRKSLSKKAFRKEHLLHLTVFQINCNRTRKRETANGTNIGRA